MFNNMFYEIRLIGLAPNPKIAKTCNDVENHPVNQLILDNEFGPIGPGGMRAFFAIFRYNSFLSQWTVPKFAKIEDIPERFFKND